jgi:transcription-repair coupling factor (superfamily II helicase)
LEDFKTKNKARVKHIAFNLIQLYKKKTRKRISVCAIDYLQNELESSFIYEDTDQTKSTRGKADMESDRPMDRWFVVM